MAKGTIHAAVNGEGNYDLFAYFFREDRYIKYSWETDAFESGYPASLNKWNFPGKCATGIDAACNGSGLSAGKVYFFKDDEYVRYDWANNTVDDNYPQKLTTWNFTGEFAKGIDAAVRGQNEYKGKIYFFRGNEYIRYDLENVTIDIGYPKPLSVWNLPAAFNDGIDSVLEGKLKNQGKLYFFKNDKFIVYDWAAQKVEGALKDTSSWQDAFARDPLLPVDTVNIAPVFGGAGNSSPI